MFEHIRPALWALVIALAAGLPAAVNAQSILDGLKAKAAKAADKLGETAGSAAEAVGNATNVVVERANETLESAKYDLRDEPTPDETRAKLDAMADATLQQLFEEEPGARALFDSSAGYAVFDTRQAAYVVTAGYGRGVAVDLDSGHRTYMKMGSGGVGVSLGFGGFDSQVVILFENGFVFNKFVVQGLDATAEAGTMTGDGKEQLALRFDDGRAVFMLTQKGWKLSAKLSGTKYWADEALN